MDSNKNSVNIIGYILLTLILLTPLILYASQFGFGIWSSHSEWSEMGSALGGVYTPILTIFMVGILYRQTVIQAALAKHTFDTNRIDKSKKQLDYHVSNIINVLAIKDANGFTISLNKLLAVNRDMAYLDTIEQWYDPHISQLVTDWRNVQGILRSMDQPAELEYSLNHVQFNGFVITQLTYEVCVALDKICYKRTEEKDKSLCYFWN
ncbi:hypothetical protein ESZ36_10905 [Colwellia demingiae]|uniref:DUF4760 domain-containing protein n=1 Tax=Colwellia demingiae TaxID=89401 RepID=A0A5C6QGD0_9GAMM|nr:hypothetical protein [Colwellia demingiae]TWX67813.1 hypothetical protein ESZ36_10905 [Colwellia demingiae]